MQDEAKLYDGVVKILTKIRRRHGDETPLVLLSPLAEGADRIAALAAIDTGVHLVVPLPMPKTEYESDFPGSLEQFHSLMRKADCWFELPYVDGNSAENIGNQANRDRQYQAVGQYVARHCQILIALWDGVECTDEQACGTAAVVKYQLEGVSSVLSYAVDNPIRRLRPQPSLLEHTERGLVYHIWTRKQDDDIPLRGKLFDERTLHPSAFSSATAAENYYARICSRFADFNRELAQDGDQLPRLISASRNSLLPAHVREQLPEPKKTMLTRFATADALAMKYQKLTQSANRRIHIFIGVGSVLFGFYAHLAYEIIEQWKIPGPKWVLPFVAIILSLGFYSWAWWKYHAAEDGEYQDKYQDYRALAEALRVQFFWGLAGIEESVVDYYLGEHRTELDWIRNALRNWRATEVRSDPPVRQDRFALVLEYWVMAQEHYFSRHRDQQRRERLETLVNGLLWYVLCIGVGLIVLTRVPAFARAEYALVRGLFAITIGSGLVIAGLLHHYKEQMAYSAHEKEHARLAVSFRSAASLMEKALAQGDWLRVLTLIRDTGVEALEENGHWVLVHRERPLEFPAAA
jgi:hypothetical protein